MKNLCYNVIEKRKRETKNVSIYQKQQGEEVRCKRDERCKDCNKVPQGRGEK